MPKRQAPQQQIMVPQVQFLRLQRKSHLFQINHLIYHHPSRDPSVLPASTDATDAGTPAILPATSTDIGATGTDTLAGTVVPTLDPTAAGTPASAAPLITSAVAAPGSQPTVVGGAGGTAVITRTGVGVGAGTTAPAVRTATSTSTFSFPTTTTIVSGAWSEGRLGLGVMALVTRMGSLPVVLGAVAGVMAVVL